MRQSHCSPKSTSVGRRPKLMLPAHPRAGGAVLIIVLTLLSTLVFLGFFYFAFTSQSEIAARSYATAEDYKLDADEILDKAYEQLLVGTRAAYPNSALWGGRHSILSKIVGPIDLSMRPTKDQPYSGAGIMMFVNDSDGDGALNAGATTGEYVRFDFNGDGIADVTLDRATDPQNTDMDSSNDLPPLALHFGKVARGDVQYYSTGQTGAPNYQADLFSNSGLTAAEQDIFLNYQPHAGYTYPDVQNLFLSYDSIVSGNRVVIPSFFRPQLELGSRVGDFDGYFTDPATASRSLRPHSAHFLSDGATPRFRNASTATVIQSGDTRRVIQPFPFRVDLNGDNIANEQGVMTGGTSVELDVDNDGDGTRDSIWMDLDLPMVTLPDGRQVVPMMSFKVVDADAYLNVNVHGNIQGALRLGETITGSATVPVSKSNLGMSPAEINPIWALIADSDTSTAAVDPPSTNSAAWQAINSAFGPPGNGIGTANAELAFLLLGREPVDGSSLLPGRYGESALPFGNARAGRTGTDDDDDSSSATGARRGARQDAHTENMLKGNNTAPALAIPPAVHPLDFLGLGHLPDNGGPRSYVALAGEASTMSATVSNGAQRRLTRPPTLTTNNPSVWPTYLGYWHHNQEATPAPYKIVGYQDAIDIGTRPLAPTNFTDDLLDEDNEFVAHQWLYNTNDARFEPSEMAGLQLSNPDFALTGEYSRLRELLPFAFREAQSALTNRRRFTTDSWDRMEFAKSYAAPRQWEFSAWSPVPTHAELSDSDNADLTSVHFPPQFGGGGTVGDDTDPYRVELRKLLRTTIRGSGTNVLSNYDQNRVRPQHPLNLNGLLVNFDSAGNPLYRPLTPHPVFPTNATPPGGLTEMPAISHRQVMTFESDPPDVPMGFQFSQVGTDPFIQEWWARYDRQRMARDIYVLLWTLGNGNDLANSATTTGVYTPEQAREMAQFAVNVVDSLDRDGVITRFEYDEDLTDGWKPIPDHVVYGIEDQQLAFSEVHHIIQRDSDNNYTATYHRDNDLGTAGPADTTYAHQFLYVELRNTSPFPINLEDGSWRIVRVEKNKNVDLAGTNVHAAVEFRSGPGAKMIVPGGNFLISCHDGFVVNGSGARATADFYADIDSSAVGLECVIPRSTQRMGDESEPPKPPLADLDLTANHAGHTPYFAVTKAYESADMQYSGEALVGRAAHDNPADGTNTDGTFRADFDLVLQRRRNLHARGASDAYTVASGANVSESIGGAPLWIEVDRFRVRETRPLLIAADGTAGVEAGFQGSAMGVGGPIASLERRQPFDSSTPIRNADTATQTQLHSLVEADDSNPERHGRNFAQIDPSVATTTTFTLWQPHFDRDFSSVMELLSIPLYGRQGNTGAHPDNLTDDYSMPGHVRAYGGPTENLATGSTLTTSARMEGYGTAAVRFLNPSATPKDPFRFVPPGDVAYPSGNRWYRLLEFLTVESGTEETIAAQSSSASRIQMERRLPGRLNLNTIRDEAVFKGVLDDNDQLAVVDASGLPTTNDNAQYQGTGRNWYNVLLALRDGLDPTAFALTGTNVYIPGSIVSRPFRDLGWVFPDLSPSPSFARDNSIEWTILRAISSFGVNLITTAPGNSHGIFDARTAADSEEDATAAGRTLSTVDFHTRNRLLGKIHNRTTNRSHVFVVWTTVGFFEAHRIASGAASGEIQIGAEATDIPRRRAFMACDMSRLEEAYEDPDPTDDLPGYYDFRKFIIYRKLIK